MVPLPDHYALMARYNQWMNDRIYQVCAKIPDDDRKRDLGAFFQSIHGTLNHLLYGDQAWLSRFTGLPVQVALHDPGLHEQFIDLWTDRIATDQRILTWVQGLSAEWLVAPFEYRSQVDGNTRCLPAWILVSHLFNHQTHHRGQVTTLITQLGYEPGVTDLPWLPDLGAIQAE